LQPLWRSSSDAAIDATAMEIVRSRRRDRVGVESIGIPGKRKRRNLQARTRLRIKARMFAT
jgi:hypothetical protein